MRPRAADDKPWLAAMAEQLHRKRVDGYPALVEGGSLSSDEAARGLRITAAIAASWRAIVDFAPEPDWIADPDRGGAYTFERIETLTDAAIKARTLADGRANDREINDLAEAFETLLWWETAQPSARFLTDATIALRSQAAEACAAREPAFKLGEAA